MFCVLYFCKASFFRDSLLWDLQKLDEVYCCPVQGIAGQKGRRQWPSAVESILTWPPESLLIKVTSFVCDLGKQTAPSKEAISPVKRSRQCAFQAWHYCQRRAKGLQKASFTYPCMKILHWRHEESPVRALKLRKVFYTSARVERCLFVCSGWPGLLHANILPLSQIVYLTQTLSMHLVPTFTWLEFRGCESTSVFTELHYVWTLLLLFS